MDKFLPYWLDFVVQEAVKELGDRYGLSPFESLRRFLNSKVYQMLCNPAMAMWEFSNPAILEMWECEQITGDPRNSALLREA